MGRDIGNPSDSERGLAKEESRLEDPNSNVTCNANCNACICKLHIKY
jgi:hypothetical protein